MAAPDEWKDRLEKLKADLARLQTAAQKPTPDSVKTVNDLLAYFAEQGTAQIDEFLGSVGAGMRKAQERLDQESQAYLLGRPDLAPQTTYRIPKLSASLKLGMRKTSHEGLDFFVYERGSETTNYLEQEISFEIVASPPPPDLAGRVAELPVSRLLVTNEVARTRVLERLKQASSPELVSRPANLEKLRLILDKLKLDEDFRRVLLLEAADGWILFYMPANSSDLGELEILKLSHDLESATYFSSADSNLTTLKELFKDVIDKQAAMLAQLGRIA